MAEGLDVDGAIPGRPAGRSSATVAELARLPGGRRS